ncbi:exocyst complex component 8-like [Littorina saxatilis]|uniref:Exocyst component Exo84 C-terminal domain-containing protein n=1 Tax=Littorina saxatilis TaxID=31220 RepID=A0AAN9AV31_9CAEN
MGDGLARILTKQSFDPEAFIAKLAIDGEDALLDMRQKVHALNEDTAQALKKNVYKNYSQFIETAKEISILEGEMYQLSNMLTEEKSLMSSMMKLSLVSDKAMVEGPKEEKKEESPEEETRRNLAFLLEKVEGCSSVTEVPGRHLVHDTDLVEVEPETFVQIQRTHAFLLSDSLMMATWVPTRRGPMRYRFQGLYELDSLAVVNVRDAGPIKNAFKILMFPETRMYQADSAKSKRQWLDILEDTKKKKAVKDKQKKEAANRLSDQLSPSPVNSPMGEKGLPSPVFKDAPEEPVTIDTDFLQADWLEELPEDLDMLIAQRNFEGAVDSVEKVTEYLKACPKGPALKEFKARIDHRVKQLTDGLMSELQVSPERSLRGGPRAARHAVTQLIRLAKSAQACDLFLKNRSAVIRYNIRQLKFEGATTLYIRCLCTVFFSSLSDTAKEFLKAFPDHYGCYSAFVIWAKQELVSFVSIFRRQVFESKASLTTIAECVQLAKKHCAELSSIGVDMEFSLASMMDLPIQQVIEETRDQMVEGIKYRTQDELWRPLNLQNKADCDKFVAEMKALGFDVKPYVSDVCFVALTHNTVQFAKSSLTFVDDLLRLYTIELENMIALAIQTVFTAQMQQFQAALKSDKFQSERSTIVKNAQFVGEKVIGRIFTLYQQNDVTLPLQLQTVQMNFRQIK